MDMNIVISNNIIEQLRKQGKRQQELADGIGVAKQTVSKMLNGARAINAIELNRIASFLGVTMDALVKLPKSTQETSFTLAFMGKITSDDGKKALELADTLSDMILFHSKVRQNGNESLNQWEVV